MLYRNQAFSIVSEINLMYRATQGKAELERIYLLLLKY
jgi:hypothetical protein